MQNILIHVEDPGALNLLEGIPESIKKLGVKTTLLAEGVAKKKLGNHPDLLIRDGLSAKEIIKRCSPSLIIVGTSENSNSFSFEIILEARSLKIHTIGLIDMWCNAKNRFRGDSSDSLFYSPNELFVPDKKTLQTFIEIGFDPKNLTLVGNPIFEKALGWKKKLVNEKSPLQKNPLRITFISEGWDKLDTNASKKNPHYLMHGRNDSNFRTIIVMQELIDSLKLLDISYLTTLRVHPNSNLQDFLPIANEFDQISFKEHPYEVCMNSHVVVGMTSMLLLEACLLGKPTIAVLPDINEKNWMPNTEYGPTITVSSRDELNTYWIKKKYLDNKSEIPNWVILNYKEKFIERVDEIIFNK